MNLWGYQQKLKAIKTLIYVEELKPNRDQCERLLMRLDNSKQNCASKIRELKRLKCQKKI